ncbi:restriction endonuclease subunit S [Aliivibrio fischeri]|uniref:restriction endonuclease subunit S n=1 Tax=Aliivibrio fischeri TaxID=668 RepID=UPI00084C8566|nr:restriction endonuclease subunit S [Aliivibrio fischeri]OED54221.1 hypothetical protein BEI47_04285 [Aliivibrio fischeri]
MVNNLPWPLVPFETLLAEPLRNGIYKKKEFHGRGCKIVNMGELFKYPRLTSNIEMNLVELTEKEKEKSLLKTGDLIFARRSLTAEGAGKCTLIQAVHEETTFESSIIRGRIDTQKALPEFYYYLFNSPIGKWLLGTILRQTAVSGITGSDLAKLKVPFPPIKVQEQLVENARTLDDKVALNRQINQTLEQMAQTLFKSWFVDFDPVIDNALDAIANGQNIEIPESLAKRFEARKAVRESEGFEPLPVDIRQLFPCEFEESELGFVPKGWEIIPLDKIANFQNGLALQKFRPDSEDDDFLPVLKIAQLRQGYTEIKEKARTDIKESCRVYNGDMIFSWSGTLMIDIWTGGNAALNQHLYKVTSKEYPLSFYLFWTKHHLVRFQHIAAAKAVTMGHIKKGDLSDSLCLKPLVELVNKFDLIVGKYLEQSINVRLQNQKLEKLRDTLLPKLISGELRLDSPQGEALQQAVSAE